MRVIVTGASGRMGRMLVQAVSDLDDAELVGATERSGSEFLGRDAGELADAGTLGVMVSDDLDSLPEADVLIDFTTVAASLDHARYAAAHSIAMVVGTTGHSAEQLGALHKILAETPVVMATNYSVGVNLALQLIEQAAAVLGADYDAEIFEAHHRHKVDAPSGTALAMGRALASGRAADLEDVAVYSREGLTGSRKRGDIGFSVMRAGAIVGEHKTMFVADEERIEINHIATDRMVFARGAVRAAKWLQSQPVGWYDMGHVLDLK